MHFLMRYPEGITVATVCDDMLYNVDFTPTFLDYAELSILNYMQGLSARTVLEEKPPNNWPQNAYYRYWIHRDPDHNAYSHYAIPDQRYKLIYCYNDGFDLLGTNSGGQDKEWELFDLERDPLELFNVADDLAYLEIKAEIGMSLSTKRSSTKYGKNITPEITGRHKV